MTQFIVDFTLQNFYQTFAYGFTPTVKIIRLQTRF